MASIKQQVKDTVRCKYCWATFSATFFVGILVIMIFTSRMEVNASISPEITIDKVSGAVGEGHYLQLESQKKAYAEDSFETAHQIVDVSSEEIIEIKHGDTLINILTDLGLSYNSANDIYLATKKIYDPRKLRVGQKLSIKYHKDQENSDNVTVDSITSLISTGKRVVVDKDDAGKYLAKIEIDELIEEIDSAKGIIDGNLSISMDKQGVPANVIANFISIFSFSIDFKRDIKKGDKFEIIYENYINPNGKVVQSGDILYASLTLGKDSMNLYRFEDSFKNVDYYDDKGFALKKMLDRKPLSFKNARVSSPFGKRRHPILKKVLMHQGVDYAAPKNTLIYAAGDGVIVSAKYNGGYGNYVKIRHNSEYSTAYGHMQKFGKGIKAGKRVKQGDVIGYVGSTGRSTGPHLHYEVIKSGKRIDPLTIRASASEKLKGKNLTNFKKVVENINATYNQMFANTNTLTVAKK